MLYFIFAQLFSLLLSCWAGFGRSDRHKDLEILLLRQQLRIMQRHQSQKPKLSRWEKLTLAVLAAKLHTAGHGA
jgi:hypothetical protein